MPIRNVRSGYTDNGLCESMFIHEYLIERVQTVHNHAPRSAIRRQSSSHGYLLL